MMKKEQSIEIFVHDLKRYFIFVKRSKEHGV